MSRVKIKDGKPDINRNMYKDIKRFDRETMNAFLQDVYEIGVKKGCESTLQKASKEISKETLEETLEEIELDVSQLKGIGPVKLEQIMDIVGKHMKELSDYGQEETD